MRDRALLVKSDYAQAVERLNLEELCEVKVKRIESALPLDTVSVLNARTAWRLLAGVEGLTLWACPAAVLANIKGLPDHVFGGEDDIVRVISLLLA